MVLSFCSELVKSDMADIVMTEVYRCAVQSIMKDVSDRVQEITNSKEVRDLVKTIVAKYNVAQERPVKELKTHGGMSYKDLEEVLSRV